MSRAQKTSPKQTEIQIQESVAKNRYRIQYLIEGLEKEGDKKMCAVLIQSIPNEFKDILQALPVLKGCFLYRPRTDPSHIRLLLDALHSCYNSHLKKNKSIYKNNK